MLWDTQLSEVKLLIKSVENCTKYFWSKPAWLYSRNINYSLQYLYKYMCTSAHSKQTDKIWWFFIWTIAMSWHLAYIWCASWTFNGHCPNMIQHQSKMYIQITADFSSQLKTNLMASETNLKFLCLRNRSRNVSEHFRDSEQFQIASNASCALFRKAKIIVWTVGTGSIVFYVCTAADNLSSRFQKFVLNISVYTYIYSLQTWHDGGGS